MCCIIDKSPLITLRQTTTFTTTCSYVTRCPLVLFVGFSRLLEHPWCSGLVLRLYLLSLIFSMVAFFKNVLSFFSGFGLPSLPAVCKARKKKNEISQAKQKISTPWQRRLGGLCLSVRHDDHSNNCCHHLGIALIILEMYHF